MDHDEQLSIDIRKDETLAMYISKYLIDVKHPLVAGAAFLNRNGEILASSGLSKVYQLIAQQLSQLDQLDTEELSVHLTKMNRITFTLSDGQQIIMASPECDKNILLFTLVTPNQAAGRRFLAISQLFKAYCMSAH